MPDTTLQDLALRLRDSKSSSGGPPRFALFLGAGASIESRIPGTESMIRHFREKLSELWQAEATGEEFEHWLKAHPNWDSNASDYSNYFQAYEPTVRGRARYIEQMVARGIPTFGYFCLAQLLSQGYISTVITTNFDDLIYEACALWTGTRPRVYAYGTTSGPIRIDPERPAIVKLHGDFLYSQLKNTDHEVSQLDPNMTTSVNRLLEEYELIVLGYGGNDSSIMKILRQIPNDLGLYWCNYGRSPLSQEASSLLGQKNVFEVQIEGVDSVMDNLLHTIGFSLPDFDEVVQQQREAIVKIIGDSKSPYVADYLNRTETALKASESIHSDERTQQLSDRMTLTLDGIQAQNRGDVDAFIFALRKLVAIDPNEPLYVRSLGATLSENGELAEGIKLLQRASLNDFDNGAALNPLGLALLDDDQIEEAVVTLLRAHDLAPDSVSIINSLAIGLFLKGDTESAANLFNEVLQKTDRDISNSAEDRFNRAAALIATDQMPDGLVMMDGYSKTPDNALQIVSAISEMKRYKKAGILGADEAILILEKAQSRFKEA